MDSTGGGTPWPPYARCQTFIVPVSRAAWSTALFGSASPTIGCDRSARLVERAGATVAKGHFKSLLPPFQRRESITNADTQERLECQPELLRGCIEADHWPRAAVRLAINSRSGCRHKKPRPYLTA